MKWKCIWYELYVCTAISYTNFQNSYTYIVHTYGIQSVPTTVGWISSRRSFSREQKKGFHLSTRYRTLQLKSGAPRFYPAQILINIFIIDCFRFILCSQWNAIRLNQMLSYIQLKKLMPVYVYSFRMRCHSAYNFVGYHFILHHPRFLSWSFFKIEIELCIAFYLILSLYLELQSIFKIHVRFYWVLIAWNSW